MIFTKEQLERITNSLLLMCQESTEHGDLPAEIYADIFELLRALNGQLTKTEATA